VGGSNGFQVQAHSIRREGPQIVGEKGVKSHQPQAEKGEKPGKKKSTIQRIT